MQTSPIEPNLAGRAYSRAELHEAFLAFGTVSEQLSGAFDALRGEVVHLRRELEDAKAGNANLAARLAALLEALPGGVLVLDAAGKVLECNPAARELLDDPVVGHGFDEVFARAAVDATRVLEHIELRKGRFVNISRRDLAGGGEVVLLADVTESHLMQTFLARQQHRK